MPRASLTVAIITPDDFRTIRKTVSHVSAQSIAGAIELVVVTPQPERLALDADVTESLHSVKVVQADLAEGSGDARAAAVRAASAPVIVFAEDHCFPMDGWAEALVQAHHAPHTAVGPVVSNANPTNLVSWADLLMGYGPWLAPGRSGEKGHLPGHNCSYKVEALLAYGDSLAALMEAETALQWRLRSSGATLYQESRAGVAHTNFDSWRTWIPVIFHAGRVFAATRSLDWSPARRAAFSAATPLVPFVRLWRHLRQGVAAGWSAGMLLRLTPVLLAGLVVDAAGQFAGTAAGAGRSRSTLVQWDFHRNVPRSRLGEART